MNRCLQGAQVPDWMTTLIQNASKWTSPNNYRPITCLPMVWKISTAQIREENYYSLASRGLFPEEQKGCHKESRCTAELLYIDQPILNESKTKQKNCYGHDWLQKGIWYGSVKLDNKMPQNVQTIKWSLKLYRENHENPASGIDRRRKKLSWNKDPKRDFPRRFSITLIIYNCIDATSSHPQKMHSRIQT